MKTKLDLMAYPRNVPEERLKTILRQPVRHKNE